MKKSIIALLFACSLFAFSPAKASTTSTTQQSSGILGSLGDLLGDLFGGGSGSGSTGSTGSKGSTGSTGGGSSLPINNNVWFLIIAGAAVGCKVIISKNNEAKAQA